MIGKIIGSYEVTELIGSGGMGSVYRCVDKMLDRDAAVKVLHPELAHQAQVAERFRSEAKVLAKLSHPNLATVYSLFEEDEKLFMVLEFVPGKTIEQILQERGALDLETTADLMGGILAGIEHAHGLGIVHRDLKPANLILSDGGYVKVMDFGIARIVGSDRLTRSGHIVGTLEYMSPEQVQQGEADARSDIYAVGVVLYEMLTGRIPFQAESDFELMKAQLEKDPAPPRQLVPGLPEPVEQVILKALAKSPDDRYQSAGEMREALVGALGTAGGPEAAKKTRLAAPGPAATRLARAEEIDAKSPAPTAGASRAAATLDRVGEQLKVLVARAREVSWQYWVIGAAALVLAVGLLLWPTGDGGGQPEGEARDSQTVADSGRSDWESGRPPNRVQVNPPGDFAPPRVSGPPGSGETPSGPPVDPSAPQPSNPPVLGETESEPETDSQRRSPFQRFADNYGEIERVVEQVRVAGEAFQEDYRSYLRSAGKWRPAGEHRKAWDQVVDFNRRSTRMKRDLKEVGDEYGLLDEGRAKRFLRKVREGAREVGQVITGDEAEASLGRLRVQAREIRERSELIASSLRTAGVSGSLDSSWTRLRTLARRLEQLVY